MKMEEHQESFRVCSKRIFCNDLLITNARATNLHDTRLQIGAIFRSANEGLPCPFTEGGRRDVGPPGISLSNQFCELRSEGILNSANERLPCLFTEGGSATCTLRASGSFPTNSFGCVNLVLGGSDKRSRGVVCVRAACGKAPAPCACGVSQGAPPASAAGAARAHGHSASGRAPLRT